MPFEVRAIQVDGGSEFKAEFEAACQAQGLRLFVLPPRSPKLNGRVERAQRTHKRSFTSSSTRRTASPSLEGSCSSVEAKRGVMTPHPNPLL
jgi:hypothetical protein